MKILSVSHYFPSHVGGLEIATGNLNQQLAKLGHQVRWVASHPQIKMDASEKSVDERPISAWAGIEKILGIAYPIPSPSGLFQLKKELAWADVVHIHDCLYIHSLIASLIGKSIKKPVVLTQHTGRLLPYPNFLLYQSIHLVNRTIGKKVLSSVDRVVFFNKVTQDYFSRIARFNGNLRFIPNGVNKSAFYPPTANERLRFRNEFRLKQDSFVVLFVGRFIDKKGISRMRYLARRFPDIEFMFVGWGPIDPRKWDLPNVRVFWNQRHEKMRAYYAAADLLLLPSQGEGFPMVVQEAVCCGVPTLISKGILEQTGQENQFFIETKIDKKSLFEALNHLKNNRQQLKSIQNKIAESIDFIWSWEKTAKAYLAVFEDVLKSK